MGYHQQDLTVGNDMGILCSLIKEKKKNQQINRDLKDKLASCDVSVLFILKG